VGRVPCKGQSPTVTIPIAILLCITPKKIFYKETEGRERKKEKTKSPSPTP
jgi:hypothetical protein